MEVEGANGQAVPYIGNIELDVTFPPEFLDSSVSLSILLLWLCLMQKLLSLLFLLGLIILMYSERFLVDHVHLRYPLS